MDERQESIHPSAINPYEPPREHAAPPLRRDQRFPNGRTALFVWLAITSVVYSLLGTWTVNGNSWWWIWMSLIFGLLAFRSGMAVQARFESAGRHVPSALIVLIVAAATGAIVLSGSAVVPRFSEVTPIAYAVAGLACGVWARASYAANRRHELSGFLLGYAVGTALAPVFSLQGIIIGALVGAVQGNRLLR